MYPHYDKDIRSRSPEGLGIPFQKGVWIFIASSSPVVILSKGCLGTNEARWVWVAISHGRVERFHTSIYSPILCKACHLVLRLTAFAHQEYKKYLQLIQISTMMTTFPLCSRRKRSDSRQARSHPPTLQPQSNRLTMGTQDPKKQNL